MELEELLNKLFTSSLEDLFKIKSDLIKLHLSYIEQYRIALIDYSHVFSQIKEDAYKITISECEKQAGEQTGYQYKTVLEKIEVIKEAISLADDMIQHYPEAQNLPHTSL